MGLAEVFGAREKVIRPVEKPEVILEPDAGLPGCAPGTRAAATAFEEELEPLPGARVLARFADGAPAIVENSYGKGKAILVGSFLAVAYQRQHDEATKQMLLGFARAAGVAAGSDRLGREPAKWKCGASRERMYNSYLPLTTLTMPPRRRFRSVSRGQWARLAA